VVAQNWKPRLFTKNTAICNDVNHSIGSEVCPMP